MSEPMFGVVFDRPDADRNYVWGPFADHAAAARFAEFVEAEIDPARVIPWVEAAALPGVRVADPVAELLTWRTTVVIAPTAKRAVCPACGHHICKGGSPCGAILRLSAVADTERCQCPGVAAPTV